ncbi:MAG: agmatinase [Bacteroidales bacterium]|jgi:agmatinase|nr:agmatinase [Bacteroidales bacterium]
MMMNHFLDMDEQYTLLDSAQYVLLPVGYDGTSTFIKGADKGPQALLDASDSLELYDPVYGIEAYKAGIYTDTFEYDFSTPNVMLNSVYMRIKHFLELKKTPAILGGEHSVSIGAIKAMSEQYENLSVLQIDAHADLRDEYHGSPYNHACVMRRAQEYAHVVQVGIRNVCVEEKPNLIAEDVFYAHQIHNHLAWIPKVIERLDDQVYLTIDLDGFDPSIVPGTGTPLPGGLTWYSVITLLEQLFASKKVVGFDVVELCPLPDNKISDVLAATLVYKIITLFEVYKKNSLH